MKWYSWLSINLFPIHQIITWRLSLPFICQMQEINSIFLIYRYIFCSSVPWWRYSANVGWNIEGERRALAPVCLTMHALFTTQTWSENRSSTCDITSVITLTPKETYASNCKSYHKPINILYNYILTAYLCLITEFSNYSCIHGFFNALQVRVDITNRLGFVSEWRQNYPANEMAKLFWYCSEGGN